MKLDVGVAVRSYPRRGWSRHIFFEQDRSVGAAKTEGVGKRIVRIEFFRAFAHVVEVTFRVGSVAVDGAGHYARVQGEHGENGFHAAGRAEQMPDLRLGGRDGDIPRVFPENLLVALVSAMSPIWVEVACGLM